MQEVADDIFNHTAELYCYITDEECTSISCNAIDIEYPLQTVGMTVSPCDDPPSLQLNVNDTQSIFADGNKTVSLGEVDADLRIRIWHFDYSMDVEVSTHSLYTD